jgi:hypothetical protein
MPNIISIIYPKILPGKDAILLLGLTQSFELIVLFCDWLIGNCLDQKLFLKLSFWNLD